MKSRFARKFRKKHVRFSRKRARTHTRYSGPKKRRRVGGRSMRKNRGPSMGGVLTEHRVVKAPYVDFMINNSLSAGTASLQSSTSRTWRANSIYDPKYSASGTFNLVAAGYKFWASLYQHYSVLRSHISVTIRQNQPPSTTYAVANIAPLKFALVLDENGTVAGGSNWTDYMVTKNSCVRTMYFNAAGTGKVKLNMSFDAKVFFKNPRPWTTDSLNPSIGANPTDAAYFMLLMQWADKGVAPVNATPAFSVDVKIWYTTMFTEPIDVNTLPAGMAMIES